MKLLMESAGIDFFGQRKRKHFSILCSEGIKSQSTAGGTFLNSTYRFDASRGNLTYRKDNRRNKQENFTYDNLNRLKTYGGIVMDYDPKGNITKKGDVGTFHYQTPYKPYALSGADIGTNKVIPPREQIIRYTSFDRPSVISENGYEASFIYNASGDRQKMTVKKGGKPLYTRYYLGGRYEMDVMGNSQKHRLYIGGDAYTAPAVYMNTGNGWALYYICRDYLGNMTHLVASNGTVVQELSYDAWGRLRNPETHAVYLPDNETELLLGRGYTGHEHLPMFGLINMNARLYDPVLGRFLSPDPYVQMPDFTQSFNRYSYCLNNPLVYVDQDGEFIHLIIGAVVGGVVNWATHGFQFNAKGLGSFAVGAAVGTLSALGGAWVAATFEAGGVAAGAGIGAVSGGVIGGGSSFLLNGGNNLIAGNNFFDNWKSSLVSGAIGGALSGAVSGGFAGGKEALRQGKNVWWGNDVKYGRNQWSLLNTEKPYQTIDFDISNVGSKNLNDCVPTTFAELNEHFGGNKSYDDYVRISNYIDGEGVKMRLRGYDNLLNNNFESVHFDYFKLQNPEYMLSVKNLGKVISVHMQHGKMYHADNIRFIKFYSNKVVVNLRVGNYRFTNLVNNTKFRAWSISGIK
ncbi:RHS repeat-associated core domain-containing protein [Tannerella forsythia]|uniref:RHS repeat domain-containing protein n=1 Tax=Tannerella forsythia TaxID=28112 RepID=UPI0028E44ABF|nr:RHS repeat-associated core domain-containing protein [Tannerella forsythia]